MKLFFLLEAGLGGRWVGEKPIVVVFQSEENRAETKGQGRSVL